MDGMEEINTDIVYHLHLYSWQMNCAENTFFVHYFFKKYSKSINYSCGKFLKMDFCERINSFPLIYPSCCEIYFNQLGYLVVITEIFDRLYAFCFRLFRSTGQGLIVLF